MGCLPSSLQAPLFEGRPLQLFLLHTGYHVLVLVGCCCLLAVFGQTPNRGTSMGGGGGNHAADAHQAEL